MSGDPRAARTPRQEVKLEDGLTRLSTEDRERFTLMCMLLGREVREIELSVQRLEEALVARYGEPREADASRSVLRLWWYGLVSASGSLRAAPHEDAARAASLLFLGCLNAHAGAGGWRTLGEGLELAGVELSHARLTEAGERALTGSNLAPLERALLGTLAQAPGAGARARGRGGRPRRGAAHAAAARGGRPHRALRRRLRGAQPRALAAPACAAIPLYP